MTEAGVGTQVGLTDGETATLDSGAGDRLIRDSHDMARDRANAERARDEIIAESVGRSLGGATIREVLQEGRRE